MFPLYKSRPHPVKQRGTPAGSILYGIARNNCGLQLQVLQEQKKGCQGPVQGPFIILNAGQNIHTQALLPLVDQVTSAEEVLTTIRRAHTACVSVANVNLLAPDPLVEIANKNPAGNATPRGTESS